MSDRQRPNIILMFPDQWRGDFLGHMGHPDARTPWADQLSAEGVSYSRAITPSPSCIPARMALMTGMSPWANGRTGYQEGVHWQPPHTLPGLLRDAGYQTMQVGKTHFAPMRAHLGFEINDMYEASVREPGFVSDYHAELRRELPLVEDPALRRHPNSWTVTPWCAERAWHNTEWITRRAIKRLQQRDPLRPFFMQVAWHRPHPPFDPPQDLWQAWRERAITAPVVGDWVTDEPSRSQGLLCGGFQPLHSGFRPLPSQQTLEARRAYLASIEHVDEQIGRLLWKLQHLGLAGNTWLVLASDHGEFCGDHHRWHKSQPHIAAARIPLIVRAPQAVELQRNTICAAPVTLTDLMPSCLRWAGSTSPSAAMPVCSATASTSACPPSTTRRAGMRSTIVAGPITGIATAANGSSTMPTTRRKCTRHPPNTP
ncbi:MAG: sulfatase-like hydrolase/transferase, partial [Planctomycetota bacterium]